ncbi:ribokinase [Cognatishimia activa]|uniref:Ribokinase n=1 Tax=Cognatishimia activa TaxID=1715691 RepID=A0A0P1ILT0_9RHOB|nr:ribokinase [Cognatishimia activa]CUI41938.1 Ribokinase [Cognatishimia activa]CUK24590.1 Ribokinase [Cognatishimia activa]
MAIYNLGSINADLFYQVPHLPGPGETLAAKSMTRGLGGKGANMSVAAARAAALVSHIGAVGSDGTWARQRLLEYGVDTRHIAVMDQQSTGHAVINVDEDGENAIVLFPGANAEITESAVGQALSESANGDTLLIQNETNQQAYAAKMGKELGMYVAYAAAPFDAASVQAVLPYLDFLILNEVEAAQLTEETGLAVDNLPVADVVITLGAKGCRWINSIEKTSQDFPAHKVDVVDTTGAGDTFTGYLLAGRDRGMPIAQAIGLAMKAGALMVTREGTADVIPDLKEVQESGL